MIIANPTLSGSVNISGSLNVNGESLGATSVSSSLATTAERVRAGDSGSRDTSTPQSGSLWFNTNTSNLEVYSGASGSGWESVGSPDEPTSYTLDYLVVAGGGGTGYDVGGGGGAGGLLSDSFSARVDYTYTITVGSGGGNGQSGDTKGTNGDDSTISGTGLTTITAIGGGGGGSYPNSGAGKDGGSGGGGANNPGPGGSGTSGQGYDGGTASSSNYGSAGGGGAGGNGANGVQGSQVAGGNPAYNSITGTSVAYAGGGYGNADSGAVYQTGYNTSNTQVGVYGFGANGTGLPNANPYNGNSGVVILKVLSSNYSGTTTGSPTVTTDGIYTILTFTSSGTYTA